MLEDALKNLGYHYFQVGEQTNDIQTMGRGFNLLWQHFLKEPHSEDMNVLLQWAQRFQQVEVLKELVSYLKPGTYRLETQKAQDSQGNAVDAVVMVPVRSSGGMRIVSPEEPEASSGSGSGSGSGESKERVIPITVTLTDASATTNFQEVSVTVDLPSEKRTGVLSVPVGALLALSADQYGVEIVAPDGTTRKVPVTIGLFAGGRVEVSGEGISEGQRVVVPQT